MNGNRCDREQKWELRITSGRGKCHTDSGAHGELSKQNPCAQRQQGMQTLRQRQQNTADQTEVMTMSISFIYLLFSCCVQRHVLLLFFMVEFIDILTGCKLCFLWLGAGWYSRKADHVTIWIHLWIRKICKNWGNFQVMEPSVCLLSYNLQYYSQ